MEQLDDAVAALEDCYAIVLPTDTVYGLAALPGVEDELFRLKGRPAGMPIAVLVAGLAQAEAIAVVTPAARRLAQRFWPGPLTLVLPSHDGETTVGVRWPDHPFVLALIERVGPLPTTSANRHGVPTPATAAEAAAALMDAPAVVVDGGPLGLVASTVVDCTGPEIVVLREGAIPASAL